MTNSSTFNSNSHAFEVYSRILYNFGYISFKVESEYLLKIPNCKETHTTKIIDVNFEKVDLPISYIFNNTEECFVRFSSLSLNTQENILVLLDDLIRKQYSKN